MSLSRQHCSGEGHPYAMTAYSVRYHTVPLPLQTHSAWWEQHRPTGLMQLGVAEVFSAKIFAPLASSNCNFANIMRMPASAGAAVAERAQAALRGGAGRGAAGAAGGPRRHAPGAAQLKTAEEWPRTCITWMKWDAMCVLN